MPDQSFVLYLLITIRWADKSFAYRHAAAPAPAKVPARGWTAVRFELEPWLRPRA